MSTAVTVCYIQQKTEFPRSTGCPDMPVDGSSLPPAEKSSISMQMNERDPFSDSIYEQQTHLADRELYSFIAAVTEIYGPEQARLSAEDWLDEAVLMDSPPQSEIRDWRSVTIAASARLATRVNAMAA